MQESLMDIAQKSPSTSQDRLGRVGLPDHSQKNAAQQSLRGVKTRAGLVRLLRPWACGWHRAHFQQCQTLQPKWCGVAETKKRRA